MAMSSAPQTTPATGLIREAIDPGRLPWTRPLARAYAQDFPSVAAWFAGNPKDPAAWSRTIRRVQQAPRDLMLTCRTLARQLDQRSAPGAAKAAAATLAHPATVAIVTGQQAGLFGGPLYTLLKAVTTIQLARHVSAEHGVTAVPVFWVDGEDHDWDEVRVAHLVTRDFGLADLSIDSAENAAGPVARRRLDGRMGATLAELTALLPPTEYTAELVARLERHYRPGAGMATAFAGWIDELLGPSGLVVFDASDPEAKPAVSGLFATELDEPCASRLAREAAHRLRRAGHTPQVEPADDAVALFYLTGTGRLPIRRADGDGYLVGDEARPAQALADEARAHPERFSPNVLLRPLAQDRLFPTVAYVAGPAELAYQAQLGDVYQRFGVEPPLLYPRASATLLDSAAVRFLERSRLPFEALQGQDDAALNQLLEAELPADVERLIAGAETYLAGQVQQLKPAVSAVDPTLAGAVDTTIDRVRETFGHLRHKVVQASKRRDQTLRRQFERTRTLVFPGGTPQERVLNVAFFVNRYGLNLGERLIDVLPLDTDQHYVLTL
jgi:bacillithiol biosynthesis cysteine-adding enzyme BshC